jgi:hypothetical protein
MKTVDHVRYKLTIGERYAVESPCGRPHFVAPAAGRAPKIYVVSRKGEVLYVGKTCQRIASRFYGAFAAKGETGYYGYQWRGSKEPMDLDIWILSFDGDANVDRELETIEAEVIFCIREQSGQWPLFQNEIHFHPSSNEHREIASRIFRAVSNRDVPAQQTTPETTLIDTRGYIVVESFSAKSLKAAQSHVLMRTFYEDQSPSIR